ncbi:MAG: HEAT repeat domain-containing protein [Roseivirga sp.]|nr:HEAT repeat domain-containing protein [Roseivirga sp.]
MKSSKEIERLIDKYYNGETSLEEEKQLQGFFLGEVVPDHLKTYQEQFRHLAVTSEITWEGFSEDKLFGKIDEQPEPVEEEKEAKVIVMRHTSKEVWFYRVAAAVVLVLVGYLVGKDSVSTEVNELKEMMLTEMEGTSASGRLKAVNYSFEMLVADEETLGVLKKVVLEESNMNVRMKGVEALARFGNDSGVRETLIEALGTEEEPAVKIALIEALVGLKEVGAIENLQKIVDDEANLKEVRDEAHMGMFKLRDI